MDKKDQKVNLQTLGGAVQGSRKMIHKMESSTICDFDEPESNSEQPAVRSEAQEIEILSNQSNQSQSSPRKQEEEKPFEQRFNCEIGVRKFWILKNDNDVKGKNFLKSNVAGYQNTMSKRAMNRKKSLKELTMGKGGLVPVLSSKNQNEAQLAFQKIMDIQKMEALQQVTPRVYEFFPNGNTSLR